MTNERSDRRKIPGKAQTRQRSRLRIRAADNPELDRCVTVTVSLYERQIDALDDRADDERTNRSALVREILAGAGIG